MRLLDGDGPDFRPGALRQRSRGRRDYAESSRSPLKGVAKALLQKREVDSVDGKPVTNKIGRLLFEDAAQDLMADYTTNGKRSCSVVQRRDDKHLAPFFEGRRMADIGTSDVRAYVAHRQSAKECVTNAFDVTARTGRRA